MSTTNTGCPKTTITKSIAALGATPEGIHSVDKAHIKYISSEKLRDIFIQHVERSANKSV